MSLRKSGDILKYRIQIAERTAVNMPQLWSDYEKVSGIPYEEESEQNVFLEMEHLLNVRPFLQMRAISVLDTEVTVSNVATEPVEP